MSTLRQTLWVAIFAGLVVLAAGTISAQEWDDSLRFPDKPPRQHFYVDEARLIAPDDGAEIDRVAGELLRDEKVPIIVVTISSLGAYGGATGEVEPYARALFNHWGLGSSTRNYGILLLVAQEDRKARIELGEAWLSSHDADAYEIMDTLIVPAFKRGEFSRGIVDGVRGLDAMARNLKLPAPTRPWWQPLLVIGLFLLAIGVAISLIRSGRKGWGWALLALLGVVLFFMIRAVMASRGSGGAFGGGFSGGGGATGSW